MPDPRSVRRASAFYSGSVAGFLAAPPSAILGTLAGASPFDIEVDQRRAWEEEISILKQALSGSRGTLYLEFDVPRLGSRIDAVLIAGPAVVPIEFKCGESRFRNEDINQVWDYALDLKNFHRASHGAAIFPILVATTAAARLCDESWRQAHDDGVRSPRRVNAKGLAQAIGDALSATRAPLSVDLDGEAWGHAPYQPTPTIIEAARALYSRHSVEAISRNDAGAKNLAVTSGALEEVIERARARHEKSIVLLTGVPGAGKTLVGLDVATRRRELGEARAVFLSGNAPLVAVLREALVRDELARGGKGVRKGTVLQKVKPFIQNVHHFRDDGVRNPDDAPYDHVVIFDEAQRAWDQAKTSDFMRRRKKILGFSQSEPEFLISYLDRHDDWAVVICLVGGGQEIHHGEAGISAWLDAVRAGFPEWKLYLSPELTDSEYGAARALSLLRETPSLSRDSRFHLSTSMRSFRSEKVSAFVKAVLDLDEVRAGELLEQVRDRYPIAVTRDLECAKRWVRDHARGSERFGLVASSQAQRLKPHAIDVRVDVDPVHWFLNDRNDTRSSYYLEDAATEFQIQGLELDWIVVTWDADLRLDSGAWRTHAFKGNSWTRVKKDDRRQFLVNAYRVLLTRARQGMVIFVPPGSSDDPTRLPAFYDQTYGYLSGLGIPELTQ